MKYLKSIFEQAILITVGITIAISIEGLVVFLKYGEMYFNWYIPGSAVIAGLLCAIPSTFLLMDIFEKRKKGVITRIIIHCLVLFAINSVMGYLFKWFSNFDGFVYVSISYFAVYIVAWVGSLIINKQEDKEINKALDDIRDTD